MFENTETKYFRIWEPLSLRDKCKISLSLPLQGGLRSRDPNPFPPSPPPDPGQSSRLSLTQGVIRRVILRTVGPLPTDVTRVTVFIFVGSVSKDPSVVLYPCRLLVILTPVSTVRESGWDTRHCLLGHRGWRSGEPRHLLRSCRGPLSNLIGFCSILNHHKTNNRTKKCPGCLTLLVLV